MKTLFKLTFLLPFLISCNYSSLKPLSSSQKTLINTIDKNIVIAHRGTTYYAPEETEEAFRWARNAGAHYLEFDLQRTKDGYLVALHDESLIRTSNIAEIYPDRINDMVSQFTYHELLKLNFGKWFNLKYPDKFNNIYNYQDILTIEDIVNIAEGKKIIRDVNGQRIIKITTENIIQSSYEFDETDTGNRPGIYVETKIPQLYPNIEIDLRSKLEELSWYNLDSNKLKEIKVFKGKVQIANTVNRVILQTFSKESLQKLNQTFTRKIPICFLLWRGNSCTDDIPNDKISTFEEWINFAIENGASIIGPSIGGAPNNYTDLLTKKHFKLLQKSSLIIHPYSFDTETQFRKYTFYCNGMFSNKADEALKYYLNLPQNDTIMK